MDNDQDQPMTALNQTLKSPQGATGQSLAASPCSLILGDCLEAMRDLPDKSVDAIITDLPYGTTACKWDAVIPFAPMWEQVRRVLKPNGVFVTTASQPFTSAIVMSNVKEFKYQWIWEKNRATGFLDAKKKPLRAHEDILVFYSRQPAYNPQKVKGQPNHSTGIHAGSASRKKSDIYHGDSNIVPSDLSGDKCPRTVLRFNGINPTGGGRSHPTQKPLELMRYMVRTYTNPGDVVLDPCMGSGTTCLAAKLEGRRYIGIEREPKYFETAQARIEGELYG